MLAHRVLLDGPPRFDPNGFTLDPAQLSEAVPEHFDALPLFWIVLSQDTQPPDHPHAIPGLRSCAKRPRERPANQPDAIPPSHSITSSARARRAGGMVRPRACAVFRLIASSNFSACITGKSAGFSPLRIRPT